MITLINLRDLFQYGAGNRTETAGSFNLADFNAAVSDTAEEILRRCEDIAAVDRCVYSDKWGAPQLSPSPQQRLENLRDGGDQQIDYVLAYIGEEIVGFLGLVLPMQENKLTANFTVHVLPSHTQADAVKEALNRELDARLMQAGRKVHLAFVEHPGHPTRKFEHASDSRPMVLSASGHGGLWRDDPEVSAMVERGFGLAQVLVFSEMKLVRSDALELPAGISTRSWQNEAPADLETDVLTLINEFEQTGQLGAVASEPEFYDAARWRKLEQLKRNRRIETFSTILYDGNRPVAWTVFDYHPDNCIAYQKETVTMRPARGRGLATLVKRANAAFAVGGVPAGTSVFTWNAFENTPMRTINRRAGYRELGPVGLWQRVWDEAPGRSSPLGSE